MFEVTKRLTLKVIYDQIHEQLRNQYNVGYTTSDTGSTGFRHIKPRTKDGKLDVVTTGAGYYPRQG